MPDVFERHSAPVGPSEVPRPAPPRSLGDLANAWLAWFGIARMLALGATVMLVGAGGYWLLNAPPPPVEASLPFAATTTTPGVATDSAGHNASSPTTVPVTIVPLPVFVHVAGAVVAPGVYRLEPGARVIDAIEAASGPTPDAILDGVNLAAPVADGQRVYMPLAGEIDPALVDNGPPAPIGVDVSTDAVPSDPVDLNRATAPELDELPGVGPSTAAAIVDDRERNGPFATVDDLDRVSGIGPAKIAALRDLVTV